MRNEYIIALIATEVAQLGLFALILWRIYVRICEFWSASLRYFIEKWKNGDISNDQLNLVNTLSESFAVYVLHKELEETE